MPFDCDICGKSFTTTQHLTQHKNRKKPCKSVNAIDVSSKLLKSNNDESVLSEYLQNYHFLLNENNDLKKINKNYLDKIMKLESKIHNYERRLTLAVDFVNSIVNYNNVGYDITNVVEECIHAAKLQHENDLEDVKSQSTCNSSKDRHKFSKDRNKFIIYPSSVVSSLTNADESSYTAHNQIL